MRISKTISSGWLSLKLLDVFLCLSSGRPAVRGPRLALGDQLGLGKAHLGQKLNGAVRALDRVADRAVEERTSIRFATASQLMEKLSL